MSRKYFLLKDNWRVDEFPNLLLRYVVDAEATDVALAVSSADRELRRFLCREMWCCWRYKVNLYCAPQVDLSAARRVELLNVLWNKIENVRHETKWPWNNPAMSWNWVFPHLVCLPSSWTHYEINWSEIYSISLLVHSSMKCNVNFCFFVSNK